MTAEQLALVQKAERSIRGARVLMEDGLHEFAVSRAYSAMFYLAEALLLGEGLAFSKHSAVIAAFGQHFAKSGRLPRSSTPIFVRLRTSETSAATAPATDPDRSRRTSRSFGQRPFSRLPANGSLRTQPHNPSVLFASPCR